MGGEISLGRTVTGKMCLDFPHGPRHVHACRTSLLPDNSWRESKEKKDYEFVPCPNHFRVKDTFEKKKEISSTISSPQVPKTIMRVRLVKINGFY